MNPSNYLNASRLRITFVGSLAGMLLNGCAMLGPNYKKPETPVPETYMNAVQLGVSDESVDANWWKIFNDPQLDQLVAQGLAGNYDIRIASARLREARALRREVGYDRYPTVTASGGYTNSLSATAQTIPGVPRRQELYDVGFDATWELDFFGRVRRQIEASTANVEAAEASRRDVVVSLISEIARNYFELRGAQYQMQVSQRNAENQMQTFQLTVARLEGGRGTEFDTSRARSQLNTTLAQIPSLQAAINRAAYRLSVLVGKQPGALLPELIDPKPLPEIPRIANIGKPEDMLRRRPDIRVAERNLAAATARVGVAVADLFPRVTVLGTLGFAAATFSALGTGGSSFLSFGPSITWAAFDLGRVRARIDAADARTLASLAEYERTVLIALEETESALTTYGQQLARIESLRSAAEASERAAGLSGIRFREGVASFIDVLDAERAMLEAQERLAVAQTETTSALVAVYKALGGGWEIATGDVVGSK